MPGQAWLVENGATFGEHLAYLRNRATMSQGMLADKVGISEARIDYFERDLLIPNRKQTHCLARAMRADVFWLLRWRNAALIRRRSTSNKQAGSGDALA